MNDREGGEPREHPHLESLYATRKIEEWDPDDRPDLGEVRPGEKPTIVLDAEQTHSLYHGTGGVTMAVELPDGSLGEVSIWPKAEDQTLRTVLKNELRYRRRQVSYFIRGVLR